MFEDNHGNRMRLFAKALLLFALAFYLAGCIFQEKPIEQRQERPIPTLSPALDASPGATIQANASEANATQNATVQPTTTPEPTPDENATQTTTASPQPQGECAVSANPEDAPGPYRSVASARFFNAQPAEVKIKCAAQDEPLVAEKHGEFYIASCSYSFVTEKKIQTISAEGDGISCATTVVVDVNQEFQKGWTFSPGDEEFTLNQSETNSTVRDYTMENSGSLTLAEITCTADQSFAAMICPTSLKPAESQPFKATINAEGLQPGEKQIVITIKEKDLEKTFYVSMTLVN